MSLNFSRPREFGKTKMPEFPGISAILGPGIIWLALAQGSGELIWWPYIIAKYGLGFLFLLLPACLIQYPVVYEIGRYTALTGESIWKGFLRLHPVFTFFLWLLMLLSFLWFGSFASAGGTALAELIGFPASLGARGRSLLWGYLIIGVCGYALLTRKKTYHFIEVAMWGVAILTVIGLTVSCFNPVVRAGIPEFISAIFIRHELAVPWDAADTDKLLTAVTFAGLGGFWTLFYSYWVLGKGIAMARLYPGESGIVPEESDRVSLRHAKRWTRTLFLDTGIGIVGNIITTLMMCLLAYATLYPQGILPQGWTIAVEQSRFFEVSWGLAGRILFLLVSASFLGDTWLSTADAVAKVHLEMGAHFSGRSYVPGSGQGYKIMIIILMVITGFTMPFQEPDALFVLTAIIGFVGTVSFSWALVFLLHGPLKKVLPVPLKPGRFSLIALIIPATAYTALAVTYVVMKYF